MGVRTLQSHIHASDTLPDAEDCSHRFLTQLWALPCLEMEKLEDRRRLSQSLLPRYTCVAETGKRREDQVSFRLFPQDRAYQFKGGLQASHKTKHQPPPSEETHTFKRRAQKLKGTPPQMLRTMGSEEVQGSHRCPVSLIPGVVQTHLGSYRDQLAPLPSPTLSAPPAHLCFLSTVTIKSSSEPPFPTHTWLSVGCLHS